jgi:alanine racemase
MGRTAEALIDPSALTHNLSRVRQAAPGARVMAVVKADAYGHGVGAAVRALAAADAFAVACLSEASALRALGVDKPVVALQGFTDASQVNAFAEHDIEPVVHQDWQLELLERAGAPRPLRVWVKIDTGMNRLGFPPGRAGEVLERLSGCASVQGPLRVMTHMANADDRADPATQRQLAAFDDAVRGTEAERSLANSGCVLGWPQTHADWVRPGIMLYGVSPFTGSSGAEHGLRPVMSLRTRLIAVSRRERGARVGYGGTWVCPETMPVGIAAIGYGDGYPRHAPSGTPVLIRGHEAPLVGRVSMDMLAIDLRGAPDAVPGDEVLLWGEGLPVERIAEASGTIAYELLCGVAGRVDRCRCDGQGAA